MTPETALSLARVAAITDDLNKATELAYVAYEGARQMTGPASGLLAGRAADLMVVVATRQANAKLASEWAKTAAECYADVGDELRMATAELALAGLAYRNGDFATAIGAAGSARSRYFYGGDVWDSALVEYRLAEIHHAAGDASTANELSGYAVERFAEMNDSLAQTRASVVMTSIAGDRERVREYLSLATKTGDVQTAWEAASLLALDGPMAAGDPARNVQDSLTLMTALAAFDGQSVDPIGAARADKAWAALCGGASAVSADGDASTQEVIRRRCGQQRSVDFVAAAWPSLVEQAYQHLQNRDVESAKKAAAALPPLVEGDAMGGIQLAVLDAAIKSELGQNPEDAIRAVVATVEKDMDPAIAGRTLAQIAAELIRFDQQKPAVPLLSGAIAAATQMGQMDDARAYTIQRIEVLHAIDDWAQVVASAAEARPLLETAGSRGQASRLHVASLQRDAAARAGQPLADPEGLFLDASDAVAEDARLEFAWRAYDRNDFAEAIAMASKLKATSNDASVLRVLLDAIQDLKGSQLKALGLIEGGQFHPDLFVIAAGAAPTAAQFDAVRRIAHEWANPDERTEAIAVVGRIDDTVDPNMVSALRRTDRNECLRALIDMQKGQTALRDCRTTTPLQLEIDAMRGKPVATALYQQRARLVQEWNPVTASDPRKIEKLELAVSKSREIGGKPLQTAFAAWISYLIATGQTADAVARLDEAAPMVLERAPESELEITLLRLNALGADGQWGPAYALALSAMNETTAAGDDLARLAILSAKVALVVGAREVARGWLSRPTTRNPSLSTGIQDLAQRFLLTLSKP
ncbi:MAG: hypothetical protein R3E66_11790 [bacterium]